MNVLLDRLGFYYNPFAYLEASADPHLLDHIFGHRIFSSAWGDMPALIFARAGGGKTAMRIYTTQICWTGLGVDHPFPIAYYLPFYFSDSSEFSRDAYLSGILQAGAVSLLIGLAHFPERVVRLTTSQQRRLVKFLDANLPAGLERYVNILAETGQPRQLSSLLDRGYVFSKSPQADTLDEMIALLKNALPAVRQIHLTTVDSFREMVELLLGEMNFRSIFLLVDGIDGFPNLSSHPELVPAALGDLLELAPGWSEQKIVIKGFLPLETEPYLSQYIVQANMDFNVTHIEWDAATLASMLKNRVYQATHGAFESLDAICGPDLRETEMLLAQISQPLPRELLALVQEVLAQFELRTGGTGGPIGWDDIQKASAVYSKKVGDVTRANPLAVSA